MFETAYGMLDKNDDLKDLLEEILLQEFSNGQVRAGI